MSVIDEVKQRIDIAEVISQYATLKKAGRNLTALCPFHSEKHPSFFVYPEQQSWHCFGACNTGGDVFSFVMKKEGVDFGEALRLLAQRAGVTIPSRVTPGVEKDKEARLYQVNQAAAQYFHDRLLNSPLGEKAKSYLDRRGVSTKTMADFQLGFSPDSWEALKPYLLERGFTAAELVAAGLVVETEDGKTHDRFRHRLMFPIRDSRGRTTGFGARVLDDSLPKYTNSPQTPVFDKSSNLYGIDFAAAAIRQQSLAVIVEGYMDVIIAHQFGFANVIASLGTAVTEKHIGAIKKLTRNVTLALDADAAGEEAMLRCADYENTLDAEIRVIILPSGKDPDEVIREDTQVWRDLVEKKAIPAIDYTFNMVTAKLDLTTAKDKSFAVERLLPIIAGIKDDTRRDHYLTKLAKLAGTSYRHLEGLLARDKPKRKTSQPLTGATTAKESRSLASPLEEYCLALLLQHPGLKKRSQELLPEYFENSENREIFVAWQQADDLPSLKSRLDTVIWEHFDGIIKRGIMPSDRIEERFTDCLLK